MFKPKLGRDIKIWIDVNNFIFFVVLSLSYTHCTRKYNMYINRIGRILYKYVINDVIFRVFVKFAV